MSTKILSVDDSRTIRLIVGKAFRPYNVTLLEASNGEEGLVVAAREKPDLVLLDVTMPVMDGVTMLTKLKEDPALKGIPIVVFSTSQSPVDIKRCYALGANSFVPKPFDLDAFKRAIDVIENYWLGISVT